MKYPGADNRKKVVEFSFRFGKKSFAIFRLGKGKALCRSDLRLYITRFMLVLPD